MNGSIPIPCSVSVRRAASDRFISGPSGSEASQPSRGQRLLAKDPAICCIWNSSLGRSPSAKLPVISDRLAPSPASPPSPASETPGSRSHPMPAASARSARGPAPSAGRAAAICSAIGGAPMAGRPAANCIRAAEAGA